MMLFDSRVTPDRCAEPMRCFQMAMAPDKRVIQIKLITSTAPHPPSSHTLQKPAKPSELADIH